MVHKTHNQQLTTFWQHIGTWTSSEKAYQRALRHSICLYVYQVHSATEKKRRIRWATDVARYIYPI